VVCWPRFPKFRLVAIPVREAQGQLGQLIAEARRGELIVLTDGPKKVRLEPGASLDLEQDSPELEAELLLKE
jgi:antitoxin (DNA-binding transcriptional repressor) of toxin-antitoxin stability system